MDNLYGIESSGEHVRTPHRKPARYLVIIDTAGTGIARLFLDTREQVAEFDAGTEEVALMTKGLRPVRSAHLPEWDKALAGHSEDERRSADVYTLDL